MHTSLLRSQKNQIFLAIKEFDLDPSDFEWSTTAPRFIRFGDKPVEAITHKPTDFRFVFDRYESDAYPRFSPSKESTGEQHGGRYERWEQVFELVKVWLANVQREYLEPDMWELSASDKKLVAGDIDDIDNSFFSVDEKLRLSVAVKEIGEYLKSDKTHSPDQISFIDSRLKHLEDAANRLGRKDWITLAMGTLANIVVGVALAPEAARELLRAAGALLGWVTGSARLLL